MCNIFFSNIFSLHYDFCPPLPPLLLSSKGSARPAALDTLRRIRLPNATICNKYEACEVLGANL